MQEQEDQILDVEKYLDYLKLKKEDPSVDFLQKIVRNHQIYIPFENLDIVNRKRINLNPDRAYAKTVLQQRGGLCYELHAMLYTALVQLNFKVNIIQGQVWNHKAQNFNPKFDHIILVVQFQDELYLLDIGFGSFYQNIINLGKVQKTESEEKSYFPHKVVDCSGEYIIQSLKEDEKVIQNNYTVSKNGQVVYKFDLECRNLSDFEQTCYKQFDNKDWFMNNITLVMRSTLEGGRIILTKNEVSKINEKGERKVEKFENQKEDLQEFYKCLKNDFGIAGVKIH